MTTTTTTPHRLTNAQIRNLREAYADGTPINTLAKQYGRSYDRICRILNGTERPDAPGTLAIGLGRNARKRYVIHEVEHCLWGRSLADLAPALGFPNENRLIEALRDWGRTDLVDRDQRKAVAA